MWEMRCANDLVVNAENEDATDRFKRWRTGIKGLKINIGKTKVRVIEETLE